MSWVKNLFTRYAIYVRGPEVQNDIYQENQIYQGI